MSRQDMRTRAGREYEQMVMENQLKEGIGTKKQVGYAYSLEKTLMSEEERIGYSGLKRMTVRELSEYIDGMVQMRAYMSELELML